MTCFIWYYIISFIICFICSVGRRHDSEHSATQPESWTHLLLLLWFTLVSWWKTVLCRSRIVGRITSQGCVDLCGRNVECRKNSRKDFKMLDACGWVRWYTFANRRTRQIQRRNEMVSCNEFITTALISLLMPMRFAAAVHFECTQLFVHDLCCVSVEIVMRRLIMDRRRPSFSFAFFSSRVCLMSFLHVSHCNSNRTAFEPHKVHLFGHSSHRCARDIFLQNAFATHEPDTLIFSFS